MTTLLIHGGWAATSSFTRRSVPSKKRETKDESSDSSCKWLVAKSPRCFSGYSRTTVNKLEATKRCQAVALNTPAEHHIREGRPPPYDHRFCTHERSLPFFIYSLSQPIDIPTQSRLWCSKPMNSAITSCTGWLNSSKCSFNSTDLRSITLHLLMHNCKLMIF